MQQIRCALARLLPKLPDDLRDNEEAKVLSAAACHKVYNLVHLIYRAKNYEGHSKDYEFSRFRWRIIGAPAITTPYVRCAIPRCWLARQTWMGCSHSILRGTAASKFNKRGIPKCEKMTWRRPQRGWHVPKGKVCIVTGAVNGIGRQIALTFACGEGGHR